MPEIICRGIQTIQELEPLLSQATVLVIGPGLGQDEWAQQLFNAAIHTHKPLIIDADALFFLKQARLPHQQMIQTPHPKEAAYLLSSTPQEIQNNRFLALEQLQQRYPITTILKGSGSLMASQDQQPPAVCSDGNPGMAVAGMGDLLSGILGALLAQKLSINDTALFGTCLHAKAGDLAAQEKGEIGLIASDLLPYLRPLINQRNEKYYISY